MNKKYLFWGLDATNNKIHFNSIGDFGKVRKERKDHYFNKEIIIHKTKGLVNVEGRMWLVACALYVLWMKYIACDVLQTCLRGASLETFCHPAIYNLQRFSYFLISQLCYKQFSSPLSVLKNIEIYNYKSSILYTFKHLQSTALLSM